MKQVISFMNDLISSLLLVFFFSDLLNLAVPRHESYFLLGSVRSAVYDGKVTF
jgi:hypothetical protein